MRSVAFVALAIVIFSNFRAFITARAPALKQSKDTKIIIISDDIKQRMIIGIGGRLYIFIIIVTGDSSVDNK